MILIVFLMGVFGGAMTTEQIHYNACEKQGFETHACADAKALHELKKHR